MVTFLYFFMMMSILALIFIINMIVYQSTFFAELLNLFKTSVGSGKWIIILMWFAGFLMSIIADVRLNKKKKTASGME